jgi:hypothetical protein
MLSELASLDPERRLSRRAVAALSPDLRPGWPQARFFLEMQHAAWALAAFSLLGAVVSLLHPWQRPALAPRQARRPREGTG